ncbi:ataxin-1 [Biomphalaria glabrata]|nr:ataxin-1 [Biomphalaria glabrata]
MLYKYSLFCFFDNYYFPTFISVFFLGVDGHSLYCTEILPSSSPPNQTVSVDGGGASRRAPLVVNGGTAAQPVQYTIIIADPQLQQNGNITRSLSSGATNILLNTLVQPQQLQHHLVSISKANNSINNLIAGANPGIIVNSSSLNGSNKFNNLLSTSSNTGVNLNKGSSGGSTAAAFPTSLIANGLNNNLDGKSISISLSPNSKLPSAVFDSSGGTEAGILILNYTEAGEPSTATLANINQLVTVHSSDFVTQGNNLIRVSASDCNHQSQPCVKSDNYQLVSGTRQDPRNSAAYNGHFVDKEDSELSENRNSSQGKKVLPASENRLIESSSGERLSRGMHSGRVGAGSGQSLNDQQQQCNSPKTTSTPSTAASANQPTMLSAGQPSMPSGIFRTGADTSSPTHQIAASGNANFNPSQYAPVYGLHSQATGHLTTIQPYGTFFPSFGGSSSLSHGFSHGSLMAASSQSHYPKIESYSAMLASIGNQAQHLGVQGAERSSRLQPSAVSAPPRPFLSSGAHIASSGTQYPATHHRLSETSTPSPGPPQATSNLSSHHLEKLAAIKGGSGNQSRELEASRELRLYGEPSSGLEVKTCLSPPSSYSANTHVPKVSFDSVVKEYGGRDSPSGRSDLYFRASLSGKEGSLKHRILTRPSDTDAPDDLSKVSGVHGLKDEPVSKRMKVSSLSSVPYSAPAHNVDSQRSNVHHGSVSHASSCHSPVNNGNSKTNIDSRGHHSESVLSGHQSRALSPYQQQSGDDNTSRYKQQAYYSPSPNWTPPPSSPSSENPPSHLQYPTHFMKGSIIQLADGTLKRVEDLRTEDFVNSAEISSDLKVDSSTVVKIEEHPDRGTAMLSFSVGEHRVQVTVEATLEHPFFVFDQGWSSCSVSRTLARYGLDCQKLNVGDVCISLTHKDVCLKAAEISQQQQQQDQEQGRQCSDSPSAHHASSSAASAQSSSPVTSSTVTSVPLKVEMDPSFVSPNSTAALSKRRTSQNELPPPQSNIVPVKKENSNNSHKARRRGVSQRNETDVKEEEEAEFDPDSDSTSSLRQRRWSAPDPVTVKADQERERERQIQANEAQKAEEAFQTMGEDNGHHH